jgi:predicted RND superfamily exporter protein
VKLSKLDWIGILFSLVAFSFSVVGLLQIESNTEDVLQWLPDRSEARQKYNYMRTIFGSDDFVVVTWPGCTLDDPRLDQFVEFVRKKDREGLIQSIVSGKDIAGRMSTEFGFSRASISRRMKGVFFGTEDPNLTCSLIELSDLGTANRIDSIQFVETALAQVDSLQRESVSIAGYAYIATFIDKKLKNSLKFYLGPSVLLATIVSLICMRNLALSAIVFIAAAGAAAASIAAIPILGFKLGGLMTIIPALVFVLATSGSIHLVRYGITAIGDTNQLLRVGWKPCAISTLTTAVGMLSLTRSDFPAIRNFGFFCAIGVLLALAFQLILVPWLLNRFGQNGLRQLADRKNESRAWQHFIVHVARQRYWITVGSLLMMVVGAIGLSKLRAQVEVESLFRKDSDLIRSITQFERSFGPLDQTEIILVFDNPKVLEFADRVDLVRQVQRAVGVVNGVSTTHSLINYLPLPPKGSSARDFFRRSTYRNVLKRERDNLENENLLQFDSKYEIWRISLRFPFTQENDFPKMAAAVEHAAKDVNSVNGISIDRPRIIYTGKTHLFNHAQLTLLSDLFGNFLLAFLIITPILVIVLRDIRLGLIAMLPNLFPTLVVFGGLAWIGIDVDLSIAMTACVALGIAVDDTTHFLIRFRDFGGSLNNVVGPVRETIGQCGPAMLYTTVIASSSLMIYYFGDLLVVSRFASVISILLLVALLADVVMLPAILFLIDNREGSKVFNR